MARTWRLLHAVVLEGQSCLRLRRSLKLLDSLKRFVRSLGSAEKRTACLRNSFCVKGETLEYSNLTVGLAVSVKHRLQIRNRR